MPEPTELNWIAEADVATDMLSSFVVPLYVQDENGRPTVFGSAFYVRAGATHFVVSAAHVLETMRTRPVFHFVSPNERERLVGEPMLSPWDGDRKDDPIDVGVLKLTGTSPPYHDISKLAVDLADPAYFSPGLLPRVDRVYAIIGFPASRSTVWNQAKQVKAASYAYRGISLPEEEYAAHNCSPSTHVILELDLEDCVDSDGIQRTFPKPQGMSGSPVWMLAEKVNSGSRVYPIVGIGIEYRKAQRALVATDIGVAIDMITST